MVVPPPPHWLSPSNDEINIIVFGLSFKSQPTEYTIRNVCLSKSSIFCQVLSSDIASNHSTFTMGRFSRFILYLYQITPSLSSFFLLSLLVFYPLLFAILVAHQMLRDNHHDLISFLM